MTHGNSPANFHRSKMRAATIREVLAGKRQEGAGPLEDPWGLVRAPADFGPFSNDILIGNVQGPGYINAFDPATGAFFGHLTSPDGTPMVPVQLPQLIPRDAAQPQEKWHCRLPYIVGQMRKGFQVNFLNNVGSIDTPLQPLIEPKRDHAAQPSLVPGEQRSPTRLIAAGRLLEQPVRLASLCALCPCGE